MIERVHRRVLERPVGPDAVPALPDRRRPARHRVEPRRIVAAQQQRVRLGEVSGGAQREEQVRRAEEAGGEVAEAVDVVREALADLGPERVGCQVERERERVGGLRVGGEPSRAGQVLALERGPDPLEEVAIAPGLRVAPEHGRGAGDQVRRVGEERGAEQVLVGGGAGVVGRRAVEGEPVAEDRVLAPDQVVARTAADEVDPAAHALELPRQDRRVAVREVHLPRRDRGDVAPARRGMAPHHVGHHPRHAAVGALVGREVAEPLGEEAVNLVVEGRRRRERLGVAGPAEPLVARRRVGRHVEEVAALSPGDVLLQAVEQRIRRDEPSGAGHVAVQHDPGDRRGGQFARVSLDRDVAEPHEGEVRLEHLLTAAAAQGVLDLGLRIAEVGGVELPRAVEHLGMAQPDHGAARPPDPEPHPADHVLPEIGHGEAGRGAEDPDRDDLLGGADRRPDRGDQPRAAVPRRHHRRPRRVVESGRAPAILREPRVVVLAVVDRRGADRAGAGTSSGVGGDDLGAAVGVADHELREQREV